MAATGFVPTVFLARSRDKADQGRKRAEKLAKSEALGRLIECGSYEEDLARVIPGADLIYEAFDVDIGGGF